MGAATSGSADGQLDGPRSVSFVPPPPPPPLNTGGMFAVGERDNSRVQVFHPNGTFAFSLGGNEPGAGNFSRVNDVDWSPGGTRIAAADFRNHRVQVFHADNGSLAFKFGQYGNGTGSFIRPQAVAYSPDGTMLAVAERGNGRIQVFYAANGEHAYTFGAYGNRSGQFGRVVDVAWSPDGSRIAVSDAHHDRVQFFYANGTFETGTGFGSTGNGTGQFDNPLSVSYSPDGGLIAVAERENHRVQVFYAANRTLAFAFGEEGDGEGQLNRPFSADWSPDGGLIAVADRDNSRMQFFDGVDGSFVHAFGSPGSGHGEFAGPTSAAFAPPPPPAPAPAPGMFVVADYTDRIQVFHPNGTFAYKFAQSDMPGPPRGVLGFQGGLLSSAAWSPDGSRIVVSDTARHRILVFHANGTFDFKFGSEGLGNGSLSRPVGTSVGPGGMIAVADSGNYRVQVFHPNGTYAYKFGKPGEFPGQFWWSPVHIAWSPDGSRIAAGHNINRTDVFYANGTRDAGFNGSEIPDHYHDWYTRSFAWSPSGDRLAVFTGWPPCIYAFHLNGTVDRTIVCGTPNVAGGDGNIRWDSQGIAWSPDGDHILVADRHSQVVRAFNVADGSFAFKVGSSADDGWRRVIAAHEGGQRGYFPDGTFGFPYSVSYYPLP